MVGVAGHNNCLKDRVKWPLNCLSLTVEIVQCDTYGDTLTVNGSQSSPI